MQLKLTDFPRVVGVSIDERSDCRCKGMSAQHMEYENLEVFIFGGNACSAGSNFEYIDENGIRKLTMFGEQKLIFLREKFKGYPLHPYVWEVIFARLNRRYRDEVLNA